MARGNRGRRRVSNTCPLKPTPSQPQPISTPLATGSDASPTEPETEPEPQTAAEASGSASHISTPLKHSSSSTNAAEIREQRDLERIIKGEMGGATYEQKDFINDWFPNMAKSSQSTLVNAVLSRLAEAGLRNQNLGFQDHPFDASKPLVPWPSSKSESAYYKPIVWLLNSIFTLAKEHRIRKRLNIIEGEPLHHHLRFYAHGLEMLEGLDGSKPLKPDGIATHGPIQTGTKVSWRDVELAMEVKGTWGKLITQGGTYSRCLFAARETRHFALVIAFNHLSSDVRFCFFRRDGLWASKALNLRQPDGFKTFVRAVAGLLSWTTLSDAGMDMFRSDRQFFIADRYLDITDVLCNRRCVRGRATRVYKVKTSFERTESTVEGQTSSSVETAPPAEQFTHRYNLRSRVRTEPTPTRWSTRDGHFALPQPATMNPLPSLLVKMGHLNIEKSQSAEPGSSTDPVPVAATAERRIPKWYTQARSEDWAQSGLGEVSSFSETPINQSGGLTVSTWDLDVEELSELKRREFVIIKESWLTEGHLNEGTMFKSVNDRFGVPRLLCDSHFTQIHERQAKFWPVWGTQPTPNIPEQRCLSRTIYLTEGHDIRQLESPRKLVEVILHAMLGHWVLFKDGWLHRDISVSNIMRITAEPRVPVEDFDVYKDLTLCTGILTDGDLAIQWEEGRFLADHCSGTLPFIAVRLFKQWRLVDHSAQKFTHTAIDDLESFLWVLLWVPLERHCIKFNNQPDVESQWWKTLNSSVITVQASKGIIIQELIEATQDGTNLGNIRLFADLIQQWHNIAQDGRVAVGKALHGDQTQLDLNFHKQFYERYLNVGFECLDSIPDSWDV